MAASLPARTSGRESERPARQGRPSRACRGWFLAADLALQSLLEPLDLAGRVDDVLRAREERMAVAAHIDAQLRSGRADRPLGPAGAAVDLRFVILGMDIGLHGCLSSDAVRAGP